MVADGTDFLKFLKSLVPVADVGISQPRNALQNRSVQDDNLTACGAAGDAVSFDQLQRMF